MMIPGGLADATGALRRDCAFKPITGEVELALAEVANREAPPVERVTRALTLILEHVGGREADTELVDALCVGDRQSLMQHFMAHAGAGRIWLTATCHQCGAPFDFLIEPHLLPVKPAGPDFPVAEVETQVGRCRFRVPTGADQRAVEAFEDMDEAVATLLRRCLVAVDDAPVASSDASFCAEDREVIEAALEDSAPEVTTELQAACPDCEFQNTVSLDPYLGLECVGDAIFEEAHTLAWHYHWSEAAILALSRERRRRYLALIDRTLRPSRQGEQEYPERVWGS
jgi:hypothetical protein